jgi:hypothetical protein
MKNKEIVALIELHKKKLKDFIRLAEVMEMDTTFVQNQIDFILDTINELRKLLEDLKS